MDEAAGATLPLWVLNAASLRMLAQICPREVAERGIRTKNPRQSMPMWQGKTAQVKRRPARPIPNVRQQGAHCPTRQAAWLANDGFVHPLVMMYPKKMARPPRRVCRERKTLTAERVAHVNR
ncbi:hypothetical protein ACWGTO_32010, partial [Mesorhizobium sp. PL10]